MKGCCPPLAERTLQSSPSARARPYTRLALQGQSLLVNDPPSIPSLPRTNCVVVQFVVILTKMSSSVTSSPKFSGAGVGTNGSSNSHEDLYRKAKSTISAGKFIDWFSNEKFVENYGHNIFNLKYSP